MLFIWLASAVVLGTTRLHAADPAGPDWIFIENESLKLGVKKTSGAGIGWFSRRGSNENLLDHFDHGRLVQQSYYGKPDGSVWDKQPWRWNPVQGGDYRNHASEVLELTHDRTTLTSRVRPRNWAGGELLPDCEMTQNIRLEGPVAMIRFTFHYQGSEIHPVAHQEVPATFIHPAYGHLVIYEGTEPWTGGPLTRSQPGWPNESRRIPEGWAAWVNDQNTGVGLFSPVAQELTCYRFGATPQAPSACSYFAPLVKFAIRPGLKFEYGAALALGTPEEMRAAFLPLRTRLASSLPTEKIPTPPKSPSRSED